MSEMNNRPSCSMAMCPGPAPGLDGSAQVLQLVKWSALVCMLLAHVLDVVGWQQSPFLQDLRVSAFIAFPFFGILIGYNAEVYRRGASVDRWLFRLLVFGLLSQVPYMFVFGQPRLNILFTLLFGLSLLRLTGWFHYVSVFCFAAFSLLSLHGVMPDLWSYGPAGVLLVYSAGYFFRSGDLSFWLFTSFCLSQYSMVLFILYASSLPFVIFMVHALSGHVHFVLPRFKWLFYGFYPMHLFVLWGFKLWL